MNAKKILIIEDDSHLADIYSKKLTAEGFDVLIAKSGNAGLKMAKKNLPDLIVLDLLLPTKSGVEVLKELKADVNLKRLPVIIASNLSEKATVDECLRLGAVDFIIKVHINLSELVLRVKKALKD